MSWVIEKIEKWIEDFNKSPSVKAMKAAYSGFSFLTGVYEVFKGIFSPEPEYGELILAAIAELKEDIHDILVDLANVDAETLISTYRSYTNSQNYDLRIS